MKTIDYDTSAATVNRRVSLFNGLRTDTRNTRKETSSYQSAQLFVEQQYHKFHGANITCDYPTLMTVVDGNHQLQAVGGIRSPEQRFFLEHYLDRPAEVALSRLFRIGIPRERIVEVGSLAGGRDRLATEFLMHQMWEYLIRAGFEYLIVTGTKTLLYKLRKLPLHHIADARAEMVPGSCRWGTYYNDMPGVVAGRLKDYDLRFFRNKAPASYLAEVLTSGDSL